MNPEYGHEINPVSRLMQIMQAQKQNEPKFHLVAERGQSRYREFVMEVCFEYNIIQFRNISLYPSIKCISGGL